MLHSLGADFYAITITRAGGTQREAGLDVPRAAAIILLESKPARAQLLRGSVTPEYARARARSLLQDCLRTTATGKAKGDLLEDLLEAIVEISRPKLIVIERNLRTPQEELDLVVTNHLSDPFWVALQSPAIFIECKNWKNAVGIDELRVFETKLADHASLCKVGAFVALHGYTAPFKRRLRELQAQGRTVFALTATDLQQAIEHRDGLPGWLMQHGVRRLLSAETTPTE